MSTHEKKQKKNTKKQQQQNKKKTMVYEGGVARFINFSIKLLLIFGLAVP